MVFLIKGSLPRTFYPTTDGAGVQSMAHDSPCMWGSRLAVPICGGGVDNVRALVDAVHERIGVQFPMDDFFLNVLGTGRLAGRLPRHLSHLGGRHGRVVILGSYKIRQPHIDALEDKAKPVSHAISTSSSIISKKSATMWTFLVRRCVEAPGAGGGGVPWTPTRH